MRVHVAKWGNSTGMRFPKSVVDALDLRPGSKLDLVVEAGEIRLTRPQRTSRQLLAEMVAEAGRLARTSEPETVDWGRDRGSEIIDDRGPR